MATLRERSRHLPTLLISGYQDGPIGRDTANTEFLAKPFALTSLLEAVRRLLDGQVEGNS